MATAEKWKDIIRPSSLLDSCTIDGKIYCAPVNIHSWQWLWLSNAAFKKAGVEVPKNWDEFVAAAPALEKAGIIPLAVGGQPWQATGAFDVLMVRRRQGYLQQGLQGQGCGSRRRSRNRQGVQGGRRRSAMAKGSNVQDWNQATNLVITGKAGGQIMGDWAQGEFPLAGQKAGTDYTCLPGLGVNEIISTGGDAFYFPLLKDEEKSKAQEVLARPCSIPRPRLPST